MAGIVVMVVGSVYITRMVMEAKAKIAALENSKKNQSVTLPLRLQAYERMALFLERIDRCKPLLCRAEYDRLFTPPAVRILMHYRFACEKRAAFLHIIKYSII